MLRKEIFHAIFLSFAAFKLLRQELLPPSPLTYPQSNNILHNITIQRKMEYFYATSMTCLVIFRKIYTQTLTWLIIMFNPAVPTSGGYLTTYKQWWLEKPQSPQPCPLYRLHYHSPPSIPKASNKFSLNFISLRPLLCSCPLR